MKLIYLASPYLFRGPLPEYIEKGWSVDPEIWKAEVQEQRYQKAIDATAFLMKQGYAVYSPIVATHPVAVKHELPKGSEYWMQFDEIILEKCDEVSVLMIDGWEESPGVLREIELAGSLSKPVTYLNPEKMRNEG